MRLFAFLGISALLCSVALAYNLSNDTVCRDLSSVLPDKVYFPDAAIYNTSIASYPFLQLRLHPSCVVRPISSYDIQTTLSVVEARNHSSLAIKGGGHNANAGFNNIDDGVTLDMRTLNRVEVGRGDQVIRVGAGAVWQDVYDVAETRNLSVLGGRIGVVGTAGFLTGGK